MILDTWVDVLELIIQDVDEEATSDVSRGDVEVSLEE